jgi:hypothetical protein
MIPQVAVDFSADSMAVLTRRPDGEGWWREGSVRFDDPEFDRRATELRARAEARVGPDYGTLLVLPEEQLLFTSFDCDDRSPEQTIRAALRGRTSFPVEDLTFDHVRRGDRYQVAVVALETLLEAETFAARYGFRPVGFVADPDRGLYPGIPYFGQTGMAETFLKGERLEPDVESFAASEAPPLPDPEAEPAPSFSSRRPSRQAAPADAPPGTRLAAVAPRLSAGAVRPGEAEVAEVSTRTPRVDALERAIASHRAVQPERDPAPDAAAPPAIEEAPAPGPAAAPAEPASEPQVAARDIEADRAEEPPEAPRAPVAANRVERLAAIVRRRRIGPGLLVSAALLVLFVVLGVAAMTFRSGDGVEVAVEDGAGVTDDGAAQGPVLAELPSEPVPEPAAEAVPEPIVPGEAAEVAADPVAIALPDGTTVRRPARPQAPEQLDLEDLYVASIDPDVAAADAIALSDAALPQDAPPPVPAPPPPGSRFEAGPDGLILPTPEGVVTPDGYRLVAGRPSTETRPRPEAAPEDVQARAEAEEDERRAELAGSRPSPRPADADERIERAAGGGLTLSELAAPRPRVRPDSAQQIASDAAAQAAALAAQASLAGIRDAVEAETPEEARPEASVSEFAVASSDRPDARPVSLVLRAVEAARAAEQRSAPRAPARMQSAPRREPPAAAAAPAPTRTVPSRANVARAATEQNAIALNRISLIGVYGTPQNRRALVRLSNGRYVRVEVGDRLDRGRVTAIGDDALRYQRGSRNIELRLPRV